jgi:hypothetical protein
MSIRTFYSWLLVFAITLGGAGEVMAADAVALYNDNVIYIEESLSDPLDLWVSPDDLARITGFVLKPEGACLAEICIPIKQDVDSDLFVKRAGKKWVNATELARKVRQGVAVDRESGVWSFGEIPTDKATSLATGMAPDFSMTDRSGNTIHLSDFRGKKVLIVTWASW